ncbi:hypothetical protein VTI28DRAFT_5716 [Corynascus sepedonium]
MQAVPPGQADRNSEHHCETTDHGDPSSTHTAGFKALSQSDGERKRKLPTTKLSLTGKVVPYLCQHDDI